MEVVLRACSDFDISFGSVFPDIQDQDMDLSEKVKVLVTQLCLTLCDLMDCSLLQASLSMEFSRQEY